MSIIVMIRTGADAAKFEEFAAANKEKMAAVRDRAAGNGLIAHRFFGNDAGETMVVDEWESREQFLAFFEASRPEIAELMEGAAVGVPTAPEFWRELESHDQYGWGA